MENITHKKLACPSCGHDDFDPGEQCVCGFNADESFITEIFIADTKQPGNDLKSAKSMKNIVTQNHSASPEDVTIREIDSWVFTFSPSDKCINLSTPALQSFRLKLTLEDLEGLLEFLYSRTGKNKTMRKLKLSHDSLADLVEKIHSVIEDKKSKISVNFDDKELKEIAALINTKLII